MTKQEIIEGNKLIAEFMEVQEYSMETYLYPEFAYNTLTEDGEYVLQEVFGEHELKYHSSWDWLMPVVEKCICDEADDSKEFEFHYSQIHDGLWELNIETLWFAVVEFIKWYNSNKEGGAK